MLLPLTPIRILAWYHFRNDGKLPYYKKNVFTKDWIRSQCKKFGGDKDFDSLYIIPVVSVLDKNNSVSLYLVDRSDFSLRLSSWISRSAFSLFESTKDKLETEHCLLMQKVYSDTGPCKTPRLQERLDIVESELEKLNND